MGDLVLTPGQPSPDIDTTSSAPAATLSLGPAAATTAVALGSPASPTTTQQSAPLPPGVLLSDVIGLVGPQGPQGVPGPQNLFVQQAPAPAMPLPGLWVELNANGTVKTMWTGTNP